MKALIACLMMSLSAGCAMTNSNNPHEDAIAAPSPDAGPALCHDGSPPPCTPRS
jgi:hypothetical protein